MRSRAFDHAIGVAAALALGVGLIGAPGTAFAKKGGGGSVSFVSRLGSTVTVESDSWVPVVSLCEPGEEVTGGGFSVGSIGFNDKVQEQLPFVDPVTGREGWRMMFHNATAFDIIANVTAICADGPGKKGKGGSVSFVSRLGATVTVESDSWVPVVSLCEPGEEVTGGGFSVGSIGFNDKVQEQLPFVDPVTGREGWRMMFHNATAFDIIANVTAICADGPGKKGKGGSVSFVSRLGATVTVESDSWVPVVSLCEPGEEVTGGGFSVGSIGFNDKVQEQLPFVYPVTGREGWRMMFHNATAFDIIANVTAICAQHGVG